MSLRDRSHLTVGCRSASSSTSSLQPRSHYWGGRGGELRQGVGGPLLVAFAEVPLDETAFRGHRAPDVCDLYSPMARTDKPGSLPLRTTSTSKPLLPGSATLHGRRRSGRTRLLAMMPSEGVAVGSATAWTWRWGAAVHRPPGTRCGRRSIGSGLIVVARTMGIRCSRSESSQRFDRPRG